ncbi:MAG: FAD-dependent oxidoreductase [Thermoleophilia bacterium]
MIVVGGGLAGLSCAHALCDAGVAVRVLEAEATVGGRARTTWHEGRPVDRGFQVMFSGYPELRKLMRRVGISDGDVRPFDGGAVVLGGSRTRVLRAGPPPRLGGLGMGDRLRMARLAVEVRAVNPVRQLEHEASNRTTAQHLADLGFSAVAIDEVFRPILGVVFMNHALEADGGYFRYLAGLLARGPAALPSDGLGMIAEWTVKAIRQMGGRVDTGRGVTELLRDGEGGIRGVRTADGDAITAQRVVLATEAPVTARMLQAAGDDLASKRVPDERASTVSAAFALSRSLYRGRAIIVNGAPRSETAPGRPRVDLVAQTTNVTRPGAASGPHIVLATTVTTPDGGSADGFEEAVAAQIQRWNPGFPWRDVAVPLGTTVHEFGQYQVKPGVRAGLPPQTTAIRGLVIAGDLTELPSLEGAVTSGIRAAEVVRALPA